MRLPIRRTPTTFFPSAEAIGGVTLIHEPHALEPLPDKARLEMLDVHDYVRQFRHFFFRPWDEVVTAGSFT